MPGPDFRDVLGEVEGLNYNVTSVEREYFDMFFFSNLKSYEGAFPAGSESS